MIIITIDLEGVLVPEVWQAVAKKTNINELTRTTRDEPDYDKLMNYRLNILQEHKLKYSDIYDVINTIDPMEGALEFVDKIRRKYQLIVLSDTFYEFASPLMQKLAMPTIFCHDLIIKDDNIVGYKLRQKDQKTKAVKSFQGLNFNVISVGDSYNDIGMLTTADKGFFLHSPDNIQKQYSQIKAFEDYESLYTAIVNSADKLLNQ